MNAEETRSERTVCKGGALHVKVLGVEGGEGV